MVRKKGGPDAPEAADSKGHQRRRRRPSPGTKKRNPSSPVTGATVTAGFLSNDAQRLIMAAVSSVMLWAVEQRLMVHNPVRG